MMRRFESATSAAAWALATGLAWAVPANAAPVSWEVDETQSQLVVGVPDQDVDIDGIVVNVRVRNPSGGNAGPWNVGNAAAVDGTIATDYVDGASIRFLSGQHDLFGLPSGSYRPNPASFDPLLVNAENPDGQFANTSSAAGVYGARVRAFAFIFEFDAAFVNFTDVAYDIDSGVLPIAAGAFAGDALDLGYELVSVAFDGVDTGLVGQPIPDAVDFPIVDALAANLVPGATISAPDPMQPQLRRLEIPVDVPLVLDLAGVPLDADVTGTIVAFATLPEPGSLSGIAAGGALLGGLVRRRRARVA